MPGIGSPASVAAQSGSLSIANVDAAGNLATDGGSVVNGVLRNHQGVALGIAMENPDLVAGESGGIAVNWGQFEGAHAFSLSGAQVLGTDQLGAGKGGRFSITAAVGVALKQDDAIYRRRQPTHVATRVGAQFTW
jgi:hypothetical protein